MRKTGLGVGLISLHGDGGSQAPCLGGLVRGSFGREEGLFSCKAPQMMLLVRLVSLRSDCSRGRDQALEFALAGLPELLRLEEKKMGRRVAFSIEAAPLTIAPLSCELFRLAELHRHSPRGPGNRLSFQVRRYSTPVRCGWVSRSETMETSFPVQN